MVHTLNVVIISLPAGPHAEFELSPILSIGIFIGILTVIICIIIAVAAALKLRTSQPGKGHHAATGNGKAGGVLGKRPGNLPIKEKISLPLSQSEDMYDEKNPDVVPTNEGELRFFCPFFGPPFVPYVWYEKYTLIVDGAAMIVNRLHIDQSLR